SLKTDGTAAVGAQSITEVQPILDYQKIRLDPSTNVLSLSNGGTVDLSSYQDNTDQQSLSLNPSTNVLSLSNGGTVDLSSYQDNTDQQSLSLDPSTNVLSLSNGGTVDLSSYQDNTDQQSLSFSTPNLSIGNGNTVDLSPLQDNLGNHTASQNLQLGTFHLSGDGDNEGIAVAADGNVGIGTLAPDASAILDMQSTNRGVLIPRMTSVQRAAISNPQEGLLVYDLTSQSFWYFQQAWQEVGVNASNLLKDADEDTHVKVENNPDEDVIRMQVAGQELTRIDSANTRLKNNLLAGRAFANVSTRTINYENMGAFTASIGQIPGWQSFKPSSGGKLDFILFLVSNISDPNYTISIYEGEGANPNKLLSTTSISNPILNDWNAISFPDEIILEAGDLYTIGFSSARGIGLELVDLYPGVRSNLSPTWDFMLRVNMFVENYGFNVVNGNVGISNPNPLHPLDFGTGTGRRIALAQNSAGSDFYGFGISNSTLEIHAASTQFDDPAMVVLSSGNVGIGTTNPTRAKLQIDGSVNSNITTFGWLNSTGNTGLSPGGAADFSLWATARIAAQEFNAHSDARIKDIQGISDSKADLNTLMQLEITDYRMKDTLTKGTDTIKKVIAQQVAEVYPQAVDQNITEVVPDIYQRAEMQDGWIMLATDLQVGERVKLISKQSAAVYEVSAVEPGRFQVTASRNAPLSLSQAVFVYGREVDDFHTVDYEALSMLNVSATQEQQRLIGALKMLLEEQQKRIEKLEKEKQVQQQTFEARLQLLEASLKQSRIAATDE
ncbi:MAG: tail fiber domain-containing protein, partial [Bacteroidota bacterium]